MDVPPRAVSRSGGECRSRWTARRTAVKQGPERWRKARRRNGWNGLEAAGHGAIGGNTARWRRTANGATDCAENTGAVTCMPFRPTRRTARAGWTANRYGNVPVEGIDHCPRRMWQKADDHGQHERQHHGVDGHAAAGTQKAEVTPVHGTR